MLSIKSWPITLHLKPIFVLLQFIVKPTMNHHVQQLKTSKKKQRVLGISIVFAELVFILAHGLLGYYYPENNATAVAYRQMLPKILVSLCALVGFGLLLSSFRFGSWLGMGSTMIITAINIQFGPLMQKFLFASVVLGFGDEPDSGGVAESVRSYWMHAQNFRIDASYVIIQNTMLGTISLLTVMTALIGKITLVHVVLITVLYDFFWNLAFSLVIKHSIRSPDFNPIYFDAYGGSYVYLFGSVFAVVLNLIYFRKIKLMPSEITSNRVTMSLAALGNAFIFILFMFLSNSLMDYGSACNARARLNVFFALAASIIGTYAGSALGGRGRVGFKQALLGTLTGGIVVSSSAPILLNVGHSLIAGSSIGAASGLLMQLIYKRTSKNQIYDTLGLFYTFLLASLMSSFVVLPLTIILLIGSQTCNSFANFGYQTINQQLQNSGIVLGVGVAGGIFSGLIILLGNEKDVQVQNGKYFSHDFGLYSAESEKAVQEEPQQIKQNAKQPKRPPTIKDKQEKPQWIQQGDSQAKQAPIVPPTKDKNQKLI